MDSMKNELFYNQKNGYDLISISERLELEDYSSEYIKFLDISRTEREAVINAIKLAKSKGFTEFIPGMDLSPGSKIYYNNKGKALFLAVIGKENLDKGTLIAGAHIDAPRLDLKQLPLFESDELCYFKTHYYGGIKKYQWLAIPLELHGTVVFQNGKKIDISIGREKCEPKFVITDLLPHLAADQMKKSLAEAFTGEGLNILIGGIPYDCEGNERVKLAVLSILNDKYGICEEDFLSAELCAVPSFDVSEIGFDRSFIGAYGHDDRVCAFAELKAITELDIPEKTCICILADKEETGSEGITGMQSAAFEYFINNLCKYSNVDINECFANSFCISADVCNAFDPMYPEVSEKRNEAKLNYGIGVCKYTGSRGKLGTNDASAETTAHIRKIFAENKVVWQMAELGKVDQGGGGTIAKFMSKRNIETIDAGVPVLSMHAPFEIVSKFDCFMTYKAMCALYGSVN